MLFESSGGQVDRVAHLPELRFALGEPAIETTSVDNAAMALEERSYFLRRVGTDGFRISYRPTIKKVVNDRRASLDEQGEIQPAIRDLVKEDFDRGATIPRVCFPADAAAIADTPKLTLVVTDPEAEWTGADDEVRKRIAEWTRARSGSPRLYPGALVWAVRKPGRELRDKVEQWLAWKRVASEAAAGALGTELDRAELSDIRTKVKEAADAAREEVWGDYRWMVIADASESDGLKAIDLGAGHSSSSESLCGRMISALKSSALLNESVGAGYLERNWPPDLRADGAWPLVSLRQSFLDGSLTRLVDPDAVLRGKIVEFVAKGDFGLGSGRRADGRFERASFRETVPPEDVMFEANAYLLTRGLAERLKAPPAPQPEQPPGPGSGSDRSGDGPPAPGQGADLPPGPEPPTPPEPPVGKTLRIHGGIPPEVWNRVGTRLLTKLRTGGDLKVGVTFELTADGPGTDALLADLTQILDDLQLTKRVQIDVE